MDPSPPAPSTRTLLSSLIAQLALACTGAGAGGPQSIASLPPRSQKLLLSLHCLLPSLLLPALDLLDRRLVSRVVLAPLSSSSSADHHQQRRQQPVYYVHSAARSRGKSAQTTPRAYEVRTRSWNCTCASFTFAAFGSPPTVEGGEEEGGGEGEGEGEGEGGEEVIWGGYSLGTTPPACKHLVACVLAERCPALFSHFLIEKPVDGVGGLASSAVAWS